MGLTLEQLTFKALVALDEAVNQSRSEPVKPSAALRFILAWLFANSGDNDRTSYDQFWRVIQDEMKASYSEPQANYMRGTKAQTELMVIARRAGFELTAEVQCELHQARMSRTERRKYRTSPVYQFKNRHNRD